MIVGPRYNDEDPAEAAAYAAQERQWNEFYDREVAKGACPYSGKTIRSCHASDLCDCFDFPEEEDL